MHLEEQPFSPSEAVQDIMKMAVAATREKGIQVLCDVASDVPSKVRHLKLFPVKTRCLGSSYFHHICFKCASPFGRVPFGLIISAMRGSCCYG